MTRWGKRRSYAGAKADMLLWSFNRGTFFSESQNLTWQETVIRNKLTRFLTLQGGSIAEISSLKSRKKTSNSLTLVGIWAEQSALFEEERGWSYWQGLVATTATRYCRLIMVRSIYLGSRNLELWVTIRVDSGPFVSQDSETHMCTGTYNSTQRDSLRVTAQKQHVYI